MSDNQESGRPWQDIAQEAGRERDPEKRKMLVEELDRVLEERAQKLRAQNVPYANRQNRASAS